MLLGHSNLAGADLSGANLAGADLSGANLTGATLFFANLSGADLSSENLSDSDLHHANLTGASLNYANLSDADLFHANLTGAALGHANLSNSDLCGANLTGATLFFANLSGADLSSANLSGADLRQTNLTNADLRDASNVRLDDTLTRGAHFSPVLVRYWAMLSNYVFAGLIRWLRRRGWNRAARQFHFSAGKNNDPWSVLRQLYAGPRMIFLLLFLIVFAVPYVGRAIWWGAVARAEPHLIRSAEAMSADLRTQLSKAAHELDELQKARQKLVAEQRKLEAAAVLWPALSGVAAQFKDAERKLESAEQTAKSAIASSQQHLDQLEQRLTGMEQRSVLSVILHWDRGLLPTVLAAMLVLYNAGLYILITSAGALRDEEERSGYSPAWNEYRHLVTIHYVVSFLFYVSLASFAWNLVDLLRTTVYLPITQS